MSSFYEATREKAREARKMIVAQTIEETKEAIQKAADQGFLYIHVNSVYPEVVEHFKSLGFAVDADYNCPKVSWE
jgi:hypothetical protein